MSLSEVFDSDVLALPLFDDAHRTLADEIEQWCGGHAEAWVGLDDAGPSAVARAMLAELGRSGWLRHLDPDQPDSDLRSLCLRRQALAYHEDQADFRYSVQELTAAAIARHGTDRQRRRYLPGLAAGTTAGALAVSAPGEGSGLLEATPDGDGFVLDGIQTWIAQGDIADVCVVLARTGTGEGPGRRGVTAFLVDCGAAGLEAEPIAAPGSWAELTFTNFRVGPEAVLGERGRGLVVALNVLERARATVAAAAIGAARRAFRLALGYARTEKDHGAQSADLADMEAKLLAASLLTAHADWALDAGLDPAEHCSAAKLYSTKAAGEIVDSAAQIFGAAGLGSGGAMERLHSQIRSLRIYEGSPEGAGMTIAGVR